MAARRLLAPLLLAAAGSSSRLGTAEAQWARSGPFQWVPPLAHIGDNANADLVHSLRQGVGAHSRPVLAVELTNGLGNQLFQVAALLSLALDRRPRFAVALPRAVLAAGGRPGAAYWDSVLRKLSPLLAEDLPLLLQKGTAQHQWHGPSTGSCTLEQVPGFGPWSGNCSQATAFNSTWALGLQEHSSCPVLTLRGYFQNAAFFTHHLPLLRWLFWDETSAKKASEHLDALVPRRENRSVVSVHYRLGDYEPNGWVLEKEYYDKALQEIQKLTKERLCCLIFSDDPPRAWQRSSGLEACAERVLVPSTAGTDVSFYMMSLTESSVLADSTFSYFAAVLAKQKRLVVAPWMKGPHAPCWSYLARPPSEQLAPAEGGRWLSVPATALSPAQLLAEEVLGLAD